MFRIHCWLNGRHTKTEPMRYRDAVMTLGEIIGSGMAPADAKYKVCPA